MGILSNTITPKLVKKFVPVRKSSSRKGDNGKVLVLGGSYIYHGAPALASLAALKTGADLVYTCVPKINVQSTRAVSPNLIVIPLVDSKLTRGAVNKLLGQIPNDLDSATIGMGLSIQDPEALKLLVKSLLARDVRLSLDATALVNYILPLLSGKNVVVTPHDGEFKRMFGETPPESKKALITADSNASLLRASIPAIIPERISPVPPTVIPEVFVGLRYVLEPLEIMSVGPFRRIVTECSFAISSPY